MTCHLHGLSVLVTRPAEQADALCELIEEAHGRPVRFPVMEILPPRQPDAARTVLSRAAEADLLVFVSVNAVRRAFPLLPEMLPAGIAIAAVGGATARALEEMGLPPTLVPQRRFDSEGLLALPALQEMEGKQVIIVRGEGGRELLREELERRGAEVRHAEVYRRACSGRSPDNLVAGWDRLVEVVTVTSVAILECLWEILGDEGRERLRRTPLVVLGQRIASRARELGCRQVLVAEEASDRGILQAICDFPEQ